MDLGISFLYEERPKHSLAVFLSVKFHKGMFTTICHEAVINRDDKRLVVLVKLQSVQAIGSDFLALWVEDSLKKVWSVMSNNAHG